MSFNGIPTLVDVARRAGVSTATVSRCLNLPDRVRPETRARVEAAVAELGYTPHFAGRALASNRTNTIGRVSEATGETVACSIQAAPQRRNSGRHSAVEWLNAKCPLWVISGSSSRCPLGPL